MRVQNKEVEIKVRQAFVNLLEEKKYSKVTFSCIAGAVGMSRNNLYYYYESKQNILSEIIDADFDKLYKKLFSFNALVRQNGCSVAFSQVLARDFYQVLQNDSAFPVLFLDKDIEPYIFSAFVDYMRGALFEDDACDDNPEGESVHLRVLQVSGTWFYVLREWAVNDLAFAERYAYAMLPSFYQFIPTVKKEDLSYFLP